jgi:hypothetical protein
VAPELEKVVVRGADKPKRKAVGLPTKLEIIKGIEGGQCYKHICTAMIMKLLCFIVSAVRKKCD